MTDPSPPPPGGPPNPPRLAPSSTRELQLVGGLSSFLVGSNQPPPQEPPSKIHRLAATLYREISLPVDSPGGLSAHLLVWGHWGPDGSARHALVTLVLPN